MRLGHQVWSSPWSLGNTSAVPLLTQMKGVESRNSNQSPRRCLNGDGRMPAHSKEKLVGTRSERRSIKNQSRSAKCISRFERLQTLEVGWNAVNLDVNEAAEQMGLQIFHVDKTEKCRAELGLIWAPFKADKPPRSTDLYQPGLRVSTIMLKAWPLPYFNQQHRKDIRRGPTRLLCKGCKVGDRAGMGRQPTAVWNSESPLLGKMGPN